MERSPSLAIRLALIGALFGHVFVTSPNRTYACSCVEPGSPSDELDRSAAVFASEVVSIGEPERGGWAEYQVMIEFDVSAVWKGPDHQTVYLMTSPSPGMCGYSFVMGREYLVYSTGGSQVSMCSRTRPLSGAEFDLEELGADRSPSPGAVGPTPDAAEYQNGGGCELGSSTTDVVVVGLMAGLLWFGLRKERPGRE